MAGHPYDVTPAHVVAPETLHAHDEVVATETTAINAPYGVAQIFCAALGVFFIVVGAIGLARSGFDSMTGQRAEIMGMHATTLLSMIHLFLGVIALASAVSRSASRAASMVLGASLIALGIIAVAEGVRELGWTGANAAAYLISGALALACAFATSAYVVGEERVARGTRIVA